MAPMSREVELLLAVHDFDVRLFEGVLAHKIPLPAVVGKVRESSAENAVEIEELRQWLNVLDHAISPLMVRDELKNQSPPPPTSVLLLRYFISKRARTEFDRDKTDYIVSFLFRTPVPEGAWQADGETFGNPAAAARFESSLVRMLELPNIQQLPEEHAQLLREFMFLSEEVADIRFFDELIEAGIMQRVHDIKHSLGESFYHPHVLALVAEFNVFFGQRFDRLFREATRQIKDYAERVVAEGGSIMSRVDGNVIVKELADIHEETILKVDYDKAQEEFRKVSRYKKAVDSRRGAREMGAAASFAGSNRTPAIAPDRPGLGLESMGGTFSTPSTGSLTASLEDTRIQEMRASIRNFVRAADPKKAHTVPVRYGNVILADAEIEAFRSDYGAEKSFRADFASAITYLVAVIARMDSEIMDFTAKRNSSYQWKPHADSLTHLMMFAQQGVEKAEQVLEVAKQRGLAEKTSVMQQGMERIREKVRNVAQLLQTVGSNQGPE